MVTVEQLFELTPAERAAIVAPLDAFSRGRGFAWQPRVFGLALRDEQRNIVGGLIGQLKNRA